MLLASSGL
jgi:hypothetical protein